MDAGKAPLLERFMHWLAGVVPASLARQCAFRVWEWSVADNPSVEPLRINIEHLASTPVKRGFPVFSDDDESDDGDYGYGRTWW